MATLYALADTAGYETALLDVNAFRIGREVVREQVKEHREDKPIDVIGVGGLVTTYGFVKDLLPWLRRDNPDALIVVGGGVASSLGEDFMRWNPSADLAVIGEGEKTFLEILDHEGDRDFHAIKGVIYREGKELVRTERRPLMSEAELNKLPYPAWSALPMEQVYFPNSPLALSAEAMNAKRRIDLISERGCPMRCTYCYHNDMGGDDLGDGKRLLPLTRWQSARYMVDLIRTARLKLAIDFVSILDENFLANRKRAFEFCDLLEKEDLVDVVKWGCLGSANTADKEVFARMKGAGCTYISYGFESGSQRDLDEICKGIRIEQNEEALRLTIEAGINPIATFMIGYPGQGLQDIYDTTAFWVKHGVLCNPFFVTPYPRTRLFEENKERILKQFGYLDKQERLAAGIDDPRTEESLWNQAHEKFVLALGDATTLVVNLTRWSDAELLGIRQLMASHDLPRIVRLAERMGEKLVLQDVHGEISVAPTGEGPMGEAKPGGDFKLWA